MRPLKRISATLNLVDLVKYQPIRRRRTTQEEKNNAATTIQKTFRGFLERTKTNKLKQDRILKDTFKKSDSLKRNSDKLLFVDYSSKKKILNNINLSCK